MKGFGVQIVGFSRNRKAACVLVSFSIPGLWTFFEQSNFFLSCSEIVKILFVFFSYFKPFVRTNIGVFILRFFNCLPIKSMPERLKAITIKSNFSFKRSLENFLNSSFFERFILRAE